MQLRTEVIMAGKKGCKNVSLELQNHVLLMLLSGMTAAAVARTLLMPRSTVSKIKRRLKLRKC